MKANTIHLFVLAAISLFISDSFVQGQITNAKINDITKPQEIEQTEANFNQITNIAGIIFKEGLMAMTDNRRSDAGEKFDKSVEVFLRSGVNVSRNQKLQNCYTQLVETDYRIEYPSYSQKPQIRSLSATCGWSWNDKDYKLADTVAKLVLTAPVAANNNTALITSASNNLNQSNNLQGFNEQKFEASPLDELAKLELTPEEQQIEKHSGVTVEELQAANGSKIASKAKVTSYDTEQKNCTTLTSPVIQNLRLDMTVNEVSKKLGKVIPVKKVENFSPEIYFASVSNLKGIKQLSLNFFKGKLFWIKVNYDNSIEWNGILEFQKIISKTLNLPNIWQGKYSFEKQLVCKNFDIEITNLSLNNYLLTLTDRNAFQVIVEEKLLNEKKKREQEKNKKENFKP